MNVNRGLFLGFLTWVACSSVTLCVVGQTPATKPDFSLQVSENEKSLSLPKDLRLNLLLKEPQIANPLYINFDERGRMWLVQYQQYPWPAGLKLVSRDKVWRNVYDPPYAPPPPHAADSPFRGADKITIHEDTDGDGKFDKHKVFLDGLNLCTAAIKGRGGVYVLNPPYLLFYADKDGDDVPDDPKPRILLFGFGFEDSHALANSLRWGPDGWLYATQGSTVSGQVVRCGKDGKPIKGEKPIHSMGQNLWRYHPEKHLYEVFAEGGGNAFGVEFDSKGRVYSGTNGGGTRGYHYKQGGYYRKNFGKHGSLANPYAFGHFPHMKHHAVRRFTHTFEIYESTELPKRYHGKLFGVAPHTHYVIHSEIGPDGSTRRTRDIAKVIVPVKGIDRANWFTPVDVQTGPDGALYIADWYSVQSNHYRNHEGKTNPDLGRLYRLQSREHQFVAPFDLSKESSQKLVTDYLSHSNRWYRETALRLLGDRKDKEVIPLLKERLYRKGNPYALDALWALNLSGGLDEAAALAALDHVDPHVRRWTIELLGDERDVTESIAQKFVKIAATENDVEVRSQLASTSLRLPTAIAMPILRAMLDRAEDAVDPHISNIVWWAVEAHANDREVMLAAMEDSAWWDSLLRVHSPIRKGSYSIPECLMLRWAMRGRQKDLQACGRLLAMADRSQKELLVQRFTSAFEGRELPTLPDTLAKSLAEVKGLYGVLLRIRSNDKIAFGEAVAAITNPKESEDERLQLMRALADVEGLPEKTPQVLLSVVKNGSDRLRNAALICLQKYQAAEIGPGILALYGSLSPAVQETAQATLASRSDWSLSLLSAVDSGKFSTDLKQAAIIRLRMHQGNAKLAELVAKHFPKKETTAAELDQQIAMILKILGKEKGVPKKGSALFHGKTGCGKCHSLFEKGGDIGPDLTSYNRSNFRNVLLAVVHPNAEIREGFEQLTVLTESGRVVTGFKIDETPKVLVIRSADGQNNTIAKDSIEDQSVSPNSLMPEGLLNGLSDQELRDLFAFLSSTTPPK